VTQAKAAAARAGQSGRFAAWKFRRTQKGYEYVIQSGDTLSSVLAEYKKQGVKVSVDDVHKATPGLKPTSMKVGQKVFIPAPTQQVRHLASRIWS
jgi:hypothetical protein